MSKTALGTSEVNVPEEQGGGLRSLTIFSLGISLKEITALYDTMRANFCYVLNKLEHNEKKRAHHFI